MNFTSRREFLATATGILAFSSLSSCKERPIPKLNGSIRQVIAAWPFMNAGPKWNDETFLSNVYSLGVEGVELYPIEKWSLLKKHDLICAATKSHTFIRGMNNKNHHAECFDVLEKAMEATAAAGYPNVMTFTGLLDTRTEKNGSVVSRSEGFQNCVEGYKKMVRIAEKKKVTLLLEPLNTKVSIAMKGHPGYQGAHIADCMEIIKAVGSPNLKLLFDVYHIQVMDGDIIRHLNENFEYIGHVQVAGVPGRGELNTEQEINYRAVMRALVENGYDGYVGHEWIPTGDPLLGLQEGISILDI